MNRSHSTCSLVRGVGRIGWTAFLVLAGCAGEDDRVPTGVGAPEGLVVVNSDYSSTSVSLVDPATGAVSRDDCINSGTKAPGLSLSLSGDVILPSAPQPGHEVVLIDRTNSALVWLDPATCAVERQLAVGTGFYSNPSDVLGLSTSKAYVTRFERNETPTADPTDLDEGDDLLVIDPASLGLLSRIPLGSYATTVEGKTIQARPERVVLADGQVYVALANLSGDFEAAGEGRIVAIDPATDTVVGTVDLPGLKGCTGLSYVSASKTLFVACGGAFSDGAAQAAGSGIVALDLAANPPVVKATLPASAFQDRALASVAFVALDATRGLVVTHGDITATPPDALWSWDLASGTATKIMEAAEGYVFGSLVADPGSGRAFLTDAAMSEPRVHVFDVSATPVLESSFEPNPALGLPPRNIGAY